jgi:hypothetical protein
MRRREAPPHIIWLLLCSDTGGYSYKTQNVYVILCFMAIATCIRTKQKPNNMRRREAPPHIIWLLCPNKNGDSYKTQAPKDKTSLCDVLSFGAWAN